jgi:hypothetical protein
VTARIFEGSLTGSPLSFLDFAARRAVSLSHALATVRYLSQSWWCESESETHSVWKKWPGSLERDMCAEGVRGRSTGSREGRKFIPHHLAPLTAVPALQRNYSPRQLNY